MENKQNKNKFTEDNIRRDWYSVAIDKLGTASSNIRTKI